MPHPWPASRRDANQKVREHQRPNGAKGAIAPEAYTILLYEVKIDYDTTAMEGGRASSFFTSSYYSYSCFFQYYFLLPTSYHNILYF
jgi:hypothetical protein